VVEPLSVDEAFLDVTGSAALLGPPRTIAVTIKAQILERTGLTASVGVAPNKFLAKLVSEWDKPDGLTVIERDEAAARLAPLPIRAMWGVGPAMETRLRGLGIHTFGDLQRLAPREATRRLGPGGEHFRRLALGEDDRPVMPDGRARSIGNEQTFGADLDHPDAVRPILIAQAEHVAQRLRRHDLAARTVTVKIRYGDFETITRSDTLDAATDRTDVLVHAACALFDRWAGTAFRPVRLIGMTASKLEDGAGAQLPLFEAEEDARERRLDAATDAICARFGRGSIHRGISGAGGGPP
jgi:nucleotidyltransferase/DNA polymerase involved in DNA repair